MFEPNLVAFFQRSTGSMGRLRLLIAFGFSVLLHALAGLLTYAGIWLGSGEGASIKPSVHVRFVGSPEAQAVELGRHRPQHLSAESGTEPISEIPRDLNRLSREPVPGEAGAPVRVSEPAVEIGTPVIKYFSSDELTMRPYPLTQLEIEGIPKLPPDELPGKIILRVWIGVAGDVTATEVEFTDLPLQFNEAAVAAFRYMRFAPGEIKGKPVGTVMRVEIASEDLRLPVE